MGGAFLAQGKIDRVTYEVVLFGKFGTVFFEQQP